MDAGENLCCTLPVPLVDQGSARQVLHEQDPAAERFRIGVHAQRKSQDAATQRSALNS